MTARSPRRTPSSKSASSNGPQARDAAEFERWLKVITALPTAAGKESRVIAWIERWVQARSRAVTLERDAHGNLLVRQKPARRGRPLYITAHLDHPAFVVRRVDGRDVELEFRGGVHDPYFERAAIEIIDGRERAHRAVITALDTKAKPFKRVTARLAKEASTIAEGDVGRWLLPAPRVTKGILHTHACDDLAAVAAALSAFERVRAARGAGHVSLLFTRAEEIGFIGAIGAARGRSIERGARLLCLENSRSFAESPIGAGAILRVGDKRSVFTPELTNRIGDVLLAHQKDHPAFRFQRKLMPGGTCEATAFACYGFESTCLCLPLGNYHNMVDIDGVVAGKRPARVGSEFIALSDFHSLITMLEVIVRDLDSAKVPPLKKVMEGLWRDHAKVLG